MLSLRLHVMYDGSKVIDTLLVTTLLGELVAWSAVLALGNQTVISTLNLTRL
jgi:hypothetical protein